MSFDTDLHHDKWVPPLCLTVSAILFALAYLLSNTQVSVASNIITPDNQSKFSLSLTPSVENLKTRYAGVNSRDTSFEGELRNIGERSGKIKVLLVPGHDEQFPGAVFEDYTEEEINLELAEELKVFLETENALEVYITRDEDGYTKEFKEYFEDSSKEINRFRADYKALAQEKIWNGEIEEVQSVDHNTAPGEVAYKLYGINKWANDNEVDIVIHVHFNDYPGRWGSGGKYRGFSIYIPQRGYRNHDSSLYIADRIRDTLNDFVQESNLPSEKDIVIEDTHLIAVGASDTLDSASVLVEYGYIYEPQIAHDGARERVLREMAYKTYLGLKDVLTGIPSSSLGVSAIIPDDFKTGLEVGDGKRGRVIELQNMLSILGYYPEDCPITGYFGSCTEESLMSFQGDYNLLKTGRLDYRTSRELEKLGEEY
jgi:N-acetylmuramoyl-L-alanine amidase